MEKILVVFTGGTIGSSKKCRTIDVDAKTSYSLLESYLASAKSIAVEFDVLKPLNILSENLISADWLTLFDALVEHDLNKYQGIIITHGTDTLPYTCAAISYMFNNTPIPIVVTASNFPLEDPRSNGLDNFTSAVDFIINSRLPGVFSIFCNYLQEPIVYLGTRMMQAKPFTNEFESANMVDFGKMIDAYLVENRHSWNPGPEQLHAKRFSIPTPLKGFSDEILYICPAPGLNYNFYDFSRYCPKAILHDLYHSATACVRKNGYPGKQFSLIEFLRYCQGYNVDVFITPINGLSDDIYISLRELMDFGAIPLVNISVEAAWVKLKLLYGNYSRDEIFRDGLLEKNLFFENLVPQNNS